jgi:hypothetical protein
MTAVAGCTDWRLVQSSRRHSESGNRAFHGSGDCVWHVLPALSRHCPWGPQLRWVPGIGFRVCCQQPPCAGPWRHPAVCGSCMRAYWIYHASAGTRTPSGASPCCTAAAHLTPAGLLAARREHPADFWADQQRARILRQGVRLRSRARYGRGEQGGDKDHRCVRMHAS